MSSIIIEELNTTHAILNRDLPEDREIQIFAETFAGKFRVVNLASCPGDLIHATLKSADHKTKQFVLLHAGQAIWHILVVPKEGERVPIGFGKPEKTL